jgi:hypothetical protein
MVRFGTTTPRCGCLAQACVEDPRPSLVVQECLTSSFLAVFHFEAELVRQRQNPGKVALQSLGRLACNFSTENGGPVRRSALPPDARQSSPIRTLAFK